MRFGIYLSSVDDFADAVLLAELACEAEAVGWDGVFIWDHMGKPNAAADPWVALAAMAMRTERIKLGPIVTPVARRRPWKLARETVTLDHLSSGRLILGAGLGYARSEFEIFGEEGSPRARAEKLDEGLDILNKLWSGQPFSYQGRHYQLENVQFLPKPVQTPRIPIWPCGAWPSSKKPYRRAARWDGIVAVLDPGTNRAILPKEVSAIKAYIIQHRQMRDPFDIVVILWSEGDGSEVEQQETEKYAAAGVTWWIEDLSTERFRSPDEVHQRLRKGPPGPR
jgi:alkanesulfonate monooxygenase SsuD/methylene tetrahydromethanopterin reductase-like flavin-dependent oxidoreductase (luciferase family)